MLPIVFLNPAERYLKKLKDKYLKRKYRDAIIKIRLDPYVGDRKSGDLAGIWGYDIFHNGVNYELAYYLAENGKGEVLVVIMAGTRENFWDAVKKYIK
ncbi:type II toxin-antitoxin system RelE/ParE family toxin [Pelotomaculum isophthalicicum JI]|uniref:Type II toxin-antitoxin system RelE/ParE family toxin n=1 Tax=Pelotomaculum isophthalicicum JI TaxID=947010 RepID=A0A9X4JV57_9FIRM|nr:type II toxin-antitoxin system RelE/ParE family toxin [Pelotomaculum isophthalicicum]MDF9406807.1 type II toxin-antitoxin system RelE/ParE family toxin [Pelotomaculum isophthalicicum JI]